MTREDVNNYRIRIGDIINYMDDTIALFDARVFTIPENNEVINNLIWRQQDAVRNSISMVAQSLYSHKELENKSAKVMQEMIFQKGMNWNDLDDGKKRGRMVIKELVKKEIDLKKGEILLKNNNDRITIIDNKCYMNVNGWSIKSAIDFNKEREFIMNNIFSNE